MSELYYTLENESQTRLFAQIIAQAYQEQSLEKKAFIIYLQGDLGAGKSFFSRAFIQFFLPQQKVKSPTYTLVESYSISVGTVHHFDLYRLGDPEELEYLAIRDLLTAPFIALVEWPQKGSGVLPEADLVIHIQHQGELESLSERASFDLRMVTLTALSEGGEEMLTLVELNAAQGLKMLTSEK